MRLWIVSIRQLEAFNSAIVTKSYDVLIWKDYKGSPVPLQCNTKVHGVACNTDRW